MPVPAILFLGCILLIFAALDITMVVSLLNVQCYVNAYFDMVR